MFSRPANEIDSRKSWLPPVSTEKPNLTQADLKSWQEQHKRVLEDIYPAIRDHTNQKRAKHTEKNEYRRRIVAPLVLGTRVMVRDTRRESKFDQLYVGPYEVTGISPTGSYILEDELGTKLHRAITDLKVIPKEDSTQEVFQVERILEHRGRAGARQYLVKWAKYPSSANSWVNENDFNDQKTVSDYWKEMAPQRQVKKARKSQAAQRGGGRVVNEEKPRNERVARRK
jgi:hypothetical protein